VAGSSLLALIDDIATLLDDVSVMTKVAAKKTAGVLGDDLALNAEQVRGVDPERELPVVWAVFKGSLLNKLILVPSALLISAFAPWLIVPLLLIGGSYLCFEGAEKLAHKFLHKASDDEGHYQALIEAASNPEVDLVQFEKDKIKGAIRTDFILSAEIIVITLGAVAASSLNVRIGALTAVALLMTLGVYGFVAAIVKLDDVGLFLLQRKAKTSLHAFGLRLGRFLLWLAPKLMHFLSVAGTAAMFLVGGGIITHNIPLLHHWLEAAGQAFAVASWLVTGAINGLFGALLGLLLVAIVAGYARIFRKTAP